MQHEKKTATNYVDRAPEPGDAPKPFPDVTPGRYSGVGSNTSAHVVPAASVSTASADTATAAAAPNMTSTVYYNGQFWVVVLEVDDGTAVRAVQAILGASEPSAAQLYQWFAAHGGALMDRALASPPVATNTRRRRARNPKRAAREASREAQRARPSTASQDAIRASIEARAAEKAADDRTYRQAEREQRYRQRRERARQRHRGH